MDGAFHYTVLENLTVSIKMIYNFLKLRWRSDSEQFSRSSVAHLSGVTVALFGEGDEHEALAPHERVALRTVLVSRGQVDEAPKGLAV